MGIDAVRDQIKKACMAKTIVDVELIAQRSSDRALHNDERLTFRFSDGSALTLQIGSNAGNYALDDARFDAREWDLSFSVAGV